MVSMQGPQPISVWPRPHPAGAEPDSFDTPAIDSETAALIRAWACPLVARAESWADLITRLGSRGYALAIRNGRLVLVRSDDGSALCSLRFLGTSLRDLAARLGRPMVKALPGSAGSGEFLATPPGPRLA